ncbi:MAG: hypothetical protein AAGB23_05250 [Pseudomonadota bacterium]
MPDFKVLRGSAVIPSGQATLTLTDGVDYTLESGIADDAWFFAIANNHFTGMGRTASGGNQNGDDFTVSVSHSGNNTTLTRYGTANNCRVDWQIIQYIGSGANEIKVRAKGTVTGGGATGTVALPGTVSNSADVVPWITGQRTSQTGRNNMNTGQFTSEISGGNAVFNRFTTNANFTLSYALVEFTGANWTVSNEQFQQPSNTTTEASVTLATAVADIAQTFIHPTYRQDTTATVGLDDTSTRVRLTSTTTFGVRSATNTAASTKQHSIWLMQNPGLAVSRYTGTMAGSGEEEIFNVSIAAVADAEQVLTTLTNDSTGGGTAMPRGYINHLLTANDNVLLRQSDNGQTSQYALEVVTLPESAGGPADITGSGSSQEAGADSATGSGQVPVSGSGGVQDQGGDTATGSGQVGVTGSGSSQETGLDAASGSGTVSDAGRIGSGSAQEVGSDQAAGSGAVGVAGTGSAGEAGQDVATGLGTVQVSGVGSTQEVGSDTATGSGGLGAGAITGSGAAQEGEQDNLTGSGAVAIQGSGSAQDEADTATGLGLVSIGGTGAAQESANDNATGLALVWVAGSGGVQESGSDTAQGELIGGPPEINGSGAAQEVGSDTAFGTSTKTPRGTAGRPISAGPERQGQVSGARPDRPQPSRGATMQQVRPRAVSGGRR